MNISAKNKILIFSGAVFGALISFIVFILFQQENHLTAKKSFIGEINPKIKLPEMEPVPVKTNQLLQKNEVKNESKTDDLRKIEGIGPKISSVFAQYQITTFKALSTKSVEELKDILIQANIRIADPTTWPEQALLAANQEWEQLKVFQTNLKGGRKPE